MKSSHEVTLPELPALEVTGYPHVSFVNGVSIVSGTRVTVRRIWDWHRRGISVDTLMARYPALGPAAVLSALAFAYDNPKRIAWERAREVLLAEGT